ncbi:MAG TPA: DUF3341 domain-containing protein [Planctomycetales bacterium]|jgi:hypothetical protein|nr:DUF3341 domain-containing protein [Planctomycetales bacterium]
MTPPTPYYGLLAEFTTPQAVLKATRQARREGYRVMDAYTPYPVRGLGAALDVPRTQIPFVVLAGGVVGAISGFYMQWWTMGADYPFNVGGRPLNSWPVFVPIAFEVLILIASLSAVLGMLFLNGLPRPHHPVFNVPRFTEASQTGFFLCIEALDPRFDPEGTRQFLAAQGAKEVLEVPHEGDHK